jgi:NADH-quinone oxidoreductase subunit N
MGKFYLFGAAVGAGYIKLALVGVVMSVVSAYYYLRVVVSMYMKDPPADDPWGRIAPSAAVALTAAVIAVLGFGAFPAVVVDWARRAAQSLL